MTCRWALGLCSWMSCTTPPPAESSTPLAPPAPVRAVEATVDTILVTIETTRADRVGPLYGHPRDTFPLLSNRAQTGRVYTRAYAPSSWTLPSIVSLYTGRSPLEHGVEAIDRQLPSELPTIGMALAGQGVQAAFFGVNPVFVVDRGLAAGFDHWQAEVGWPAGRLNQAVFRWLDEHRQPQRPLFLHIHYFDPHCPYIPPQTIAVSPPIADSMRTVPASRLDEMGGCYRIDRQDGTPELDLDIYLDRYDRELRAVDQALDRLLQRLTERGILGPEDRLVVTADHGEAFWEHDDYGHSHTLWAETTRVPLIIWDADGPGLVETPTGLTGLTLGLREGRGAPPLHPEDAGPVVQSTRAAGVPWVAVIATGERWLSDGTTAWRTDPGVDPLDAATEVVSTTPEPDALVEARKQARVAPPLDPSDEELELLKALGYSF